MDFFQDYINILNKELKPAMGCTEPIAIAYCASVVKDVLKTIPTSVQIEVSGNIIKNVKSVIVPNTGQLKGIKTAVAIGLCGGQSQLGLEVLSQINDDDRRLMRELLDQDCIEVIPRETPHCLDLYITATCEEEVVKVHLVDDHLNIVYVEKNGDVLYQREGYQMSEDDLYQTLTMEKIYQFANEVDLSKVSNKLKMQIDYNNAISKEGLNLTYGANIGKVLLKCYGDDVKIRAKAMAASASDARMNGCELPVVINSGSGNQGITVSLPLLEYAQEYQVKDEVLYRSLIISNLSAIYIKYKIGKLSAYCGAVSAGASAGAGIAYMLNGDYRSVAHTFVNALAITSGIVCDGAKASCAAKIAASIDAGILGYEMHNCGEQFYGGDGIVSKGIENTIENISCLCQQGMKETDKEIIRIMNCPY